MEISDEVMKKSQMQRISASKSAIISKENGIRRKTTIQIFTANTKRKKDMASR